MNLTSKQRLETCRLGCDIGGTFTDVVLLNEITGHVTNIKVPTTPLDPTKGAIEGIRQALKTTKVQGKEINYLIHASTIATNAIIGQEGLELPTTALITTKGFRDALEIGMNIRDQSNVYDFFVEKPKCLIPRYLRLEASERVRYDGRIVKELDEEEIRHLAGKLKKFGVKCVAVSLLFSFVNPTNERRIKEILHREMPDAYISISHEISPVFREYQRTSTTVVNVILMPIIEKYLSRLEEEVRKMGIEGALYIMKSNGGIMSFEGKSKPVHIMESGPAAGAISAANLAKVKGFTNLISLDMGGTTAKVCLILDGKPDVTTGYEIGGKTHSGRLVESTGVPISIPVIDLVEIGAGGGSIAWIDKGVALNVGPKSAGAAPGPMCYGRGGLEPAITDANVVLGILNPNYFLGGEMKIYPELAKKGIKERIADPLNISVIQAADAIVRVAEANMTQGIRLVSVEKGYDPRELPLIAFGGAGGTVAADLADEMKIPKVIIPKAPGLFSAYGLVGTDIRYDYSQTHVCETLKADVKLLNQELEEMEERAMEQLRREEIPQDRQVINRFLDMKYNGQGYTLSVTCPRVKITQKILRELENSFYSAHNKHYGHSVKEPTEIVNLNLTVIGKMQTIKISRRKQVGRNAGKALKGSRDVFFKKSGYVETLIYDRYKLRPGNVFKGPSIVEEFDSTTVIPPGHTGSIDEYSNIVLSRSRTT